MSDILELQKGEGKWIKFTVTRNKEPLPLSSATLFFGMKKAIEDTEYVYKIEDGDPGWDKVNADKGIVRANLSATVTKALEVRDYEAQARFILTADTDVDKTQRVTIRILSSVIPD